MSEAKANRTTTGEARFRLRVQLSDAYFIAERQQQDAISQGDYTEHWHTLRLAAAATRYGPRHVIVALLRLAWPTSGGPALEDFDLETQHSVDAFAPLDGETWSARVHRASRDLVARQLLIEDVKLRLRNEGRPSLRDRYKQALVELDPDRYAYTEDPQ